MTIDIEQIKKDKEYAQKVAYAVYLAVEEGPAKDISDIVIKLIGHINSLLLEYDTLRATFTTTVNQVRKERGLEPIPEGDVILNPDTFQKEILKANGDNCRKGVPGCCCKTGFAYEDMCPNCRDEPNRDIYSCCVCDPKLEIK